MRLHAELDLIQSVITLKRKISQRFFKSNRIHKNRNSYVCRRKDRGCRRVSAAARTLYRLLACAMSPLDGGESAVFLKDRGCRRLAASATALLGLLACAMSPLGGGESAVYLKVRGSRRVAASATALLGLLACAMSPLGGGELR